MINLKNLVPRVYSKESRDFQLLGHIYDTALNAPKLSIDAFDPATRNSLDERFLDLACRTIGFFKKNDYDAKTLSKLIPSFKYIMYHKGTIKAIREAARLILNAQNISEDVYITQIPDTCTLDIYLPESTKGIGLLEEMFDYILPVGYDYTIKLTSIEETDAYKATMVMSQSIKTPELVRDKALASMNYITSDSEGVHYNYDHLDIFRYYIPDSEGNVAYNNGIPRVYPVVDSEGRIAIGYDSEGNPIIITPTSEYVPVYSDENVKVNPEVNNESIYNKLDSGD